MSEDFLQRAIALAESGMRGRRGGPFGAVVVHEGEVVGEGCNEVTSRNDPTAHAEMEAIRDACSRLGRFQLHDCEIYASCEPCPMCLSAIYWARIRTVHFAATRQDAAEIGFDDARLYAQIPLGWADRDVDFRQGERDRAREVMQAWYDLEDRVDY